MISLPDDILNIVCNNLSINEKSRMRVICKDFKYFIGYMDIRINKFDEKLKETFVSFTIDENIKMFVPLGVLIVWESSLCRCIHSNNTRIRKPHNITLYQIKDLIYKYAGQNNNINMASVWFYEAMVNWVMLEKQPN